MVLPYAPLPLPLPLPRGRHGGPTEASERGGSSGLGVEVTAQLGASEPQERCCVQVLPRPKHSHSSEQGKAERFGNGL